MILQRKQFIIHQNQKLKSDHSRHSHSCHLENPRKSGEKMMGTGMVGTYYFMIERF